jgi:putative membrane protein
MGASATLSSNRPYTPARHPAGKDIMIRNWILGIAAAAALASSATTASAADEGSQKFIKEAIEGNLAEIAVGKLAQEKGQSEGVRSFGAQLVANHTAANEKAAKIANSIGVTPPTASNKKQQAVYDKLSKLSGDRRFAKAMVKDHKKDIREFEKEAKKKNDPAADFANEYRPYVAQAFGDGGVA